LEGEERVCGCEHVVIEQGENVMMKVVSGEVINKKRG
jgi:hypothetical protein